MIQTIGKSQFIDAFRNMGRSEQFSYDALCAMFDYIENYEDDSGEQVELDVIALCCDWAEDDVESIASQYDIDLSDDDGEDTLTDEEKAERVMEYLEENSPHAVELSNGNILFVQF